MSQSKISGQVDETIDIQRDTGIISSRLKAITNILADEEEKEAVDDLIAVKIVDYAMGIRTMRFIGGQLFDYEEFRRDEEDEEDDDIDRFVERKKGV
jgi:orotate phosphoribosyltransferase-like protein